MTNRILKDAKTALASEDLIMNQPVKNSHEYEPTLEINQQILKFLESKTRPVTAAELVRELKLPYQDVYNALITLIVLDMVVDVRPAGFWISRREMASDHKDENTADARTLSAEFDKVRRRQQLFQRALAATPALAEAERSGELFETAAEEEQTQ